LLGQAEAPQDGGPIEVSPLGGVDGGLAQYGAVAGDYPSYREQRAQGAATCPPPENLPQFAPGPGE